MAAIAMTPTDAQPRERKLLLVVDAPSLLHRNHHARTHTRITDRSGRPAWALHGMLRQIIEAIVGFAPDAVIFRLDDRTASVRRDFDPGYKAGRAEKDPELVEQLERAGALLDALGLATLTPPGLEPTTSTPPAPPGPAPTTGTASSSPPTATPSPTSVTTPRCCA